MTDMRRLRAIITVLGTLLPASIAHTQGAGCMVNAHPPQRVELPDGRVVSVDLQHVAVSGGVIMAVGRHAHVFPRVSTPVTPAEFSDTFIGFTIDSTGTVSIVPSPFPGRRVAYPRVAAAADGFHVVFVTGDDSIGKRNPFDRGTLWYAHFARERWNTPERVADLANVAFNSELSSELLARGRDLALVLNFDEQRGGDRSSTGGLIVMRRHNDAWSADTLHTPNAPTHVRAVFEPSSDALAVVYAQLPPQEVPGRPVLYLTRYDSSWTEPRRLLPRDSVRTAALPELAPLDTELVVSWTHWQFWRYETAEIRWLRLGPSGKTVTGPPVASGATAYPFEFVMLGRDRPIWLFHGDLTGKSLALVTATDTVVARLGTVAMPFDNPAPKAIALSGTRLMVFTMKVRPGPNEPMGASYATMLEVRCARSVQRE